MTGCQSKGDMDDSGRLFCIVMKVRHDMEKESDKTAMIIAAIFWVAFIYGMICGI